MAKIEDLLREQDPDLPETLRALAVVSVDQRNARRLRRGWLAPPDERARLEQEHLRRHDFIPRH